MRAEAQWIYMAVLVVIKQIVDLKVGNKWGYGIPM